MSEHEITTTEHETSEDESMSECERHSDTTQQDDVSEHTCEDVEIQNTATVAKSHLGDLTASFVNTAHNNNNQTDIDYEHMMRVRLHFLDAINQVTQIVSYSDISHYDSCYFFPSIIDSKLFIHLPSL